MKTSWKIHNNEINSNFKFNKKKKKMLNLNSFLAIEEKEDILNVRNLLSNGNTFCW